ncbi:MAG: cation:proton antiporter [Candidatus Coatesbacteria bacterium]|nr:cation:proton antiporter [Candidatus Coatesbacteria bacterium]
MEEVELIFILSVLLLVGYAFGVLAKKVKLPEVTGYIGAGIILKQFIFGLDMMSEAQFKRLFSLDLVPINHLALALIAFAVCGGLRIEQMKRLGKGIIYIAFVQAFATFVIVAIGISIIAPFADVEGIPSGKILAAMPLALVLGGIATATAPAATVAVIRELRAKGPFTTTLLATVAIDDAIALLIFAFGLTIAEGLLTAGASAGAASSVWIWLGPLLEVVGSLVVGMLVGLAFDYIAKKVRHEVEMMTVSLGIITFASGLSMLLGLSPLLTIMSAGFVLVNLSQRNQRVFASVEAIQGPIFVVFFTLAGTQLHLENLISCGIIGSVFLVFRFLGKVGGTYLGAVFARVRGAARRHLGFALLPQAGVAIGLMLVAQESPHFLVHKSILVDVVLASVALNELLGPPLAAHALRKSGEVPASRPVATSRAK